MIEGATLGDAEAYCSLCGKSFAAGTTSCPDDGTPLVHLAAEHDELLGKVLDGRYKIRSPLGAGGMGTVYVGVQLSVDREVAIKVIHPTLASDRSAVKRFLREARLASRLNQPSIVNVYDFGQSEGVLFLVTELLRGHTLANELGDSRRLPHRRAAIIGVQLCDALEAAHAQDIVHRDLKPGNIMILDDPPGRDLVKVLDFGLAKSLGSQEIGSHITTNLGAVLGTPLYMSPEQIEGGATDQRSDLYALGCILYEMVAGTPPFVEDAISAILARHIADAPPPLPSHVPPRFRALVDRLLAKAPSDRPSAAGDVRIELQRSLEHASLESGPIIPTSPDTVPDLRIALAATAAQTAARRRRPWIPALAAALVVLAGIVAFVAIGTRDRPLPPPPAAQPSMVPVIVDAPVMIDAAPMIVDAAEAAPIPIDAAPVRHVTHSAATVRKPAPPRDAGNDLDFLPTTH